MIRLTLLALVLSIAGCESKPQSSATVSNTFPPEVVAERAKLSAEDRALVEAQEWCVINSEERLGSMGAPIKLTIKGQPVFICCGGCKKKAESDPDKTLSKLEELKAKAKAEKDNRK